VNRLVANTSTNELTNPHSESPALRALTDDQRERLSRLLDEYLSQLEQGVPADPQRMLDENPDLVEALQLYLDSLTDLQGMSAGFQNSGVSDDVAKEEAASDGAAGETQPHERRLGDYMLGCEVGRGGMGVVYEARQISLGRRVALKVLPFAAVLDSRQIARFKNEAQAAAQIHHPNIVPVFAIGAERGVHYYAMQFSDGLPLDRAIRDLRRQARLAVEEAEEVPGENSVDRALDEICSTTCRSFLTDSARNRKRYYETVIRLGVDAAEALHAAHEYGVVHRDIKPSNLMVDQQGKIWITDFGLARCQNNKSLTQSGDVIGTFRYMSPEQACGKATLVDHRTDIYSLAATLYELLTLEPIVSAELDPRRTADAPEPTALRRVRADIPCHLETVILKALSRNRDDRYATAQEFADDLRRIITGKPVLAQPLSVWEKVQRWSNKHQRAVTLASFLSLLLGCGLAVSSLLISREKARAEQNAARAEKHLERAIDAVDRFGSQLAERLATIPGAAEVRHEVLQETLEYFREFARDAAHDSSLQDDIALTYSKIGVLSDEIGSSQEALQAHAEGLALARGLAAKHPANQEYQQRLAVVLNNFGLSLMRAGKTTEALRCYEEALTLQVALHARQQPDVLLDLASTHSNLGLLRAKTNDTAAAETSFREAIRLYDEHLRDHSNDLNALRKLAAAYNNLGSTLLDTQPKRAAEYYVAARKQQEAATQLRPRDPRLQSELALTLNNIGSAHTRAGQLAESIQAYEQAIAIQTQLSNQSPAQWSYRHGLAVSYNNVGLAQTRQKLLASAEQSFARSQQFHEELIAHSPENLELRSSIGGVYNNHGIVLEEEKRYAEAATAFRAAIEHQQLAFKASPDVALYRSFLSKHYFNLGRVLRQLNQLDEARTVALARRELWSQDQQRLFSVAEELVTIAAQAELTADTASETIAQECCQEATKIIQTLLQAGFQPPARWYERKPFASVKAAPTFAAFSQR
jgi:serine/threonine protein kinase/Tfp pilus assembly protein PilF